MRYLPTPLGARINLLLFLFMLALAGTTALLIIFSFKRTQDAATNRSREGLEAQARSSLQLAAEDNAGFGQFIVSVAQQDSVYAARFLVDLPRAGGSLTQDPGTLSPTPGGDAVDARPGRISDVLLPASVAADAAARRDVEQSAALDALMPNLLADEFDAVAAYFISVRGVSRYYPPASLGVPRSRADAPLSSPGFAEATSASNVGHASVWTAPHADPAAGGDVVSVVTPVYDGDVLLGVIGLDLSLNRLIARADTIKVTPSSYSFVIDRNGKLIPGASSDLVQPAIDDPGNTAFQSTLASMRAGTIAVDRTTLAGRDVFVAYAPLGDFGGSLAVVAPIDEITAQAAAVRASIDDEGNRTLTIALITMAAFFVLALAGVAYLTKRLLTQPINELVVGTRQLAAGNFAATIPVKSHDELGALAGSFNYMSAEIRQQNEALREREEQYRNIFQSTSDGLLITTLDGRVVEANRAAYEMHGATYEEFLAIEHGDHIHPDERESRLAQLDKVHGGGHYHMRSRDVRQDGTAFDVDVFGTSFTYRGSQHALVVLRDVTEQVAAEKALTERAQLATLQAEIGAALTETTDLHGMLQRCAEAIVARAGGAFARIWLIDDAHETLVLHASAGQYTRLDGDYSRLPLAGTGMATIVRERRPLTTNDAQASPRIRDHDWARREGIVAFAGYPLVVEDEVLGMVSMFGRQELTDVTVEGIAATARSIAVGIKRERAEAEVRASRELLEQRVQERTREIAGLLEVSRAVGSTLELRPLVRVILDALQDAVQYTGASLLTLDEDALVILDARGPFSQTAADGAVGIRFPLERIPAFLEIIGRGDVVSIPNVLDDSPDAKMYRRIVGGLAGAPQFDYVRAWMAVPLKHKDRVIGMLSLSRDTPYAFTEQHERVARAIGAQAAIAMENARLFEQTEERTRELATLLRVSQNVSSTIELQPLLHLILEQIQAVADYDRSAVYLLDEDGLRMISVLARTEEAQREIESRVGRIFALGPQGVPPQPVIIGDIRDDTPDARAFRRLSGPLLDELLRTTRSWMCVPLMQKDRPIGMIVLSSAQPGLYTARHAQLVGAIAAHAAVTIENARLFEETQRRTSEMSALLEVGRNVASTLELEPLLHLILEQVQSVVPYDRSGIMIRDDDELVSVAMLAAPGLEMYPGQMGIRVPMAEAGLVWERMATGQPAIVDDITDDSPLAREYRERNTGVMDIALERVRSFMAVPMILNEEAIGMMMFTRKDPHAYTQRHADLAAAIGTHAAVALENARLFEQTQARTRELSLLLKVSSSVASTLELRQLVGLILDELNAVIDYTGSSLLLLEGDHLTILDARAPGAEVEIGVRFSLEDAAELWQRISELETVIIEDIRAEEDVATAYRRVIGDRLMSTPAFSNIRSWMGVPIVRHDRVIGMLTMSRTEPAYFTAEHATLARAVADQAAIAIENARLFEETGRRAREMEALLRADAELFRSLDIDTVLSALVDVTVDVMRADKCVLTVVEDGVARVRASRNFSEEGLALINRHVGDPSPQGTLPPATFILNDVGEDPRPDVGPIWELEGVCSYMAVPIAGRLAGGFGIAYTTPHVFGLDEQRVFEALAARGAVAIKNAELYERAQHAATLEERQRLARELHDSVSQALYGIALGARTARTLLDRDPREAEDPMDYVLSLAEAGLAEMRALIFELRPESLETEGLVAAIEKQVASTRARYGIEVIAEFCDEPAAPLPVLEAMYRIAQEALHNVVKHARASSIQLELVSDDGHLELDIRDDGDGFDPGADFPGHLGLLSMRERATRLGGEFEIESANGHGTRIHVRVPLRDQYAS